MTSYRYIGYGVTDSNGVAHLDHDKNGNPINGYTGTGAGEVDIIASTDNPITSSSIVSETYELLDGKWLDIASESTHKTDYTKYPNNDIPITYESDCTVLANSTSSEYRYGANYSDLASLSDCTVEFDLYVASSSVNNPYMYVKGWQPYFSSQVFTRDTWLHIKLVLENGTGKCYVDGVETVVTGSYNTSLGYLQFRYNNATLKFKNLVVY